MIQTLNEKRLDEIEKVLALLETLLETNIHPDFDASLTHAERHYKENQIKEVKEIDEFLFDLYTRLTKEDKNIRKNSNP
jgi:hypothetical protein